MGQPYLEFTPDLTDDETVATYDELPLWSAMFGLLLLDEVPLSAADTVLDVGCGTGFPLIELAERLGPTATVHGIDPWKEGLERAAQKIVSRGTPNITLHDGNASALPFPGGTFDLIVSNLGVNNFDDRAAALRECRRVTLPGARIALTTNLQGHMHEFYDAFEQVLKEEANDAAMERLRTHVAHRATVPAVRTLLEEAGFAVTRVVNREGSMRFANGTALLNHHFIKLGFLDGWKKVARGNEQRLFRSLESELNERARHSGVLHLTIPMAYVEAAAI